MHEEPEAHFTRMVPSYKKNDTHIKHVHEYEQKETERVPQGGLESMQYSRSWSCSMGGWLMSAAIVEASKKSFTKLQAKAKETKEEEEEERREDKSKCTDIKQTIKSSKNTKRKKRRKKVTICEAKDVPFLPLSAVDSTITRLFFE